MIGQTVDAGDSFKNRASIPLAPCTSEFKFRKKLSPIWSVKTIFCPKTWDNGVPLRDEQMNSNSGRFKPAFANWDKKQTMIDLRGISSKWFSPIIRLSRLRAQNLDKKRDSLHLCSSGGGEEIVLFLDSVLTVPIALKECLFSIRLVDWEKETQSGGCGQRVWHYHGGLILNGVLSS